MQLRGERFLKGLALGLIVIGAGTIAVALAADIVGLGGKAGLGAKQVLVAAFGGVNVALGVLLALPSSRRYIRAWQPPPALTQPPGSAFVLATWFGLLAGAGDVLSLLVDRYISRKMIFQGSDFVWMAPLANLVVFALVAAVLILVSKRVPRLASLKVVVFIFALLLHYSVLLKITGLHNAASLLLAAGLAKLTADVVARHPAILYFVIQGTLTWPGAIWSKLSQRRQSTGPIGLDKPGTATSVSRREFLLSAGALVGGLFLGVHAGESLGESRRWARLGPARQGAPNVILIVMDTVRAQSTSLHGYARPTTPNLEQFARRGTTYTRAFSTAPWTLPSHASMFTGRFPHELTVGWEAPLDGTYPTLAEMLAANGYVTAGFVANTEYCSAEFGLSRGFFHYEDYRIAAGQMVDSSSLSRNVVYTVKESLGNYDYPDRKNAAQLTQAFRSWLAKQNPGWPFFAFLNYYDAHAPYLPPLEFARKFSPKRPTARLPVGPNLEPVSGPELKDMNDAYDSAIAYIDNQLGELFDELDQKHVLDNSLVIITSDHGEQFGEHGLADHSSSLYTQLLHVPLVISFPPGMAPEPRVSTPVSLRDIPATVFEAIGLENHIAFPGLPLVRRSPVELGGNVPRDNPIISEVAKALGYPAWYPAMIGPMRSVVAEGKHYIQNLGDGSEELYDIDRDLAEELNLAATTEGERLLPRFRALLDSAVRE